MKNLFIIFFVLITFDTFSQSIFSALRHDDTIDLRNDTQVIEVKKTTVFYNKDGTETKKEVLILNHVNRVKSELRYNSNGILEMRITQLYDSTGTRSLKNKMERWHPLLGRNVEVTTFEYDTNGFMIKVVDRDENNKIFRETHLKNNQNGHPVELKLYLSNSQYFGKEVAEYDYENNLVTYAVLDNDGKAISTSKHKIDFSLKDFKNSNYDENGNIIKSGKV